MLCEPMSPQNIVNRVEETLSDLWPKKHSVQGNIYAVQHSSMLKIYDKKDTPRRQETVT